MFDMYPKHTDENGSVTTVERVFWSNEGTTVVRLRNEDDNTGYYLRFAGPAVILQDDKCNVLMRRFRNEFVGTDVTCDWELAKLGAALLVDYYTTKGNVDAAV